MTETQNLRLTGINYTLTMDNRRVLKSHRQRSYGKILPSPVRGGLLSKVKRYLSGSALDFASPQNKRPTPSRPLANASVIRNVSLAPELLLTPANNSMIDPDQSTNRVLSSFFQEKGDQPLTAIEYEGVMSLLEKSKANITLQHPDDTIADNNGDDKHNNSSLAPFTQKILRNTSMVDPNLSSSTAPDFEPVYHTFSENSRANTSMKRVYQFSGLPSPYKTRIRVPNVAARKVRRVTGLPESQVLPKMVPGDFKPRSATANSLLTVLSGNLDLQKGDPRPLYNSYSRTKRNAQISDELTFEKKSDNMGASDIAKTISHSSMSESALKTKKNNGFGLDEISDRETGKDKNAAEEKGPQKTEFHGKSLFERIGIPEQSATEEQEQSTDTAEGTTSKVSTEAVAAFPASAVNSVFSSSTRDEYDEALEIAEGESKKLKPITFGAQVQPVNHQTFASKDTSQLTSAGSALSKAGSNTAPSTLFGSTKSNPGQNPEGSSNFVTKPALVTPAFSFGTSVQGQNLTFGSKTDLSASGDAPSPPINLKSTSGVPSGPKFSFGSSNATTSSDVPKFSFGSAKQTQSKSAFEVPGSSQQPNAASAHAFTFGAPKPAEVDSAPKFSFNSSKPAQDGTATKFLFGSSQDTKADSSTTFSIESKGVSKPLFAPTESKSEPTPKVKTAAETQPKFSFGKNKEDESAESKESARSEPAPTGFAFGQFKPTAKSEASAEKPKLPTFNFGARAAKNASSESSFSALPAFGGSPFQFGRPASKDESSQNSHPLAEVAKGDTETTLPQFGAQAKEELNAPLFQFGTKLKADNSSEKSTIAAAKPSPFSFSSNIKGDASQPFQFGSVKNKAESKPPAFSFQNQVSGKSGEESASSEHKPKSIFGSGTFSQPSQPGFTFGKSSSGVSETTAASAFSFSGSLNDAPSLPSALNTNNNGGSKPKPTFSFGLKGKQDSEADSNATDFVFPDPIYTEGKAEESEAKRYQSLFPFE